MKNTVTREHPLYAANRKLSEVMDKYKELGADSDPARARVGDCVRDAVYGHPTRVSNTMGYWGLFWGSDDPANARLAAQALCEAVSAVVDQVRKEMTTPEGSAVVEGLFKWVRKQQANQFFEHRRLDADSRTLYTILTIPPPKLPGGSLDTAFQELRRILRENDVAGKSYLEKLGEWPTTKDLGGEIHWTYLLRFANPLFLTRVGIYAFTAELILDL